MIQIIRTFLSLTLLASALAFGRAAEKGKGLGDGHDGNRTSITHLITLFDEAGLPIKATDKQPRPISMRNTCGECHDYDKWPLVGIFIQAQPTSLVEGWGNLGC